MGIFLFVSGGIIVLLMFLILLTTINSIANREKIDNEYEYFYNLISRYIKADKGGTDRFHNDSLKDSYNITVNFVNSIEGEEMLYLFDGNNKLFAICDKIENKTYLTSLTRAEKMVKEYENKYRKSDSLELLNV